MPRTVNVIVVGYAPHGDIVDPEILADYQDFPVGRTFELEDARACLRRGVFPPPRACAVFPRRACRSRDWLL